jgi:cytochrome c-type biogenesis protein CcmH/NrfF
MPSAQSPQRQPRIRFRVRTFLVAAIVCTAFAAALRGDATTDRYQRLAAKMQCTCGCTQPMLKACSNMNCSYKASIQAGLTKLADRARSNESDDLILQSFVQEFGPDVLAVPPTTGFGALAWSMPWIAALAGIMLVFYVIRRWKTRQPAVATAPVSGETLDRVRDEIERELRKLE